jgi:hypothetical protein
MSARRRDGMQAAMVGCSGVRILTVAACALLAASLALLGSAPPLRGLTRIQARSTLDTTIETGGFVGIGRVAVVGPTEIWGVSDGGLVLYDGQSWTATDVIDPWTMPVAVDNFGDSVWVATEDCRLGPVVEGRAVLQAPPWQCTIGDLVADAADSVVAVGKTDDGRGLVLFHDDGDWRRLVLDDVPRLTAVDLTSDGELWAAGDGNIVSIANGVPSVRRNVIAGCYIFALQAKGRDDVWIAGKCGSSDSPFEEGQPFVARYDGRSLQMQQLELVAGVWWISDIAIVNERLGWATAHGKVLYRYDGDSWSVCADFGGGLTDMLNAVAVIDEGHAFFTASTGDPYEFVDGTFRRFLGRRSYEAPLGDYGLLTGVAVSLSGEGWAVGLGGPVLHRLPGTERWVPARDVPHGDDLVSVAAASNDNVWFASYRLRGSAPSVLVHFDGTAFALHEAPTTLPIWGLLVRPGGDAWAVASTKWLGPGGDRLSELMRWDGSGWRIVASVPGEELVALSSRDGWTVTTAGSGVFECAPDGCSRVPGFDGYFVKDLMFSSPEHGYAVGNSAGGPGVFEYADGGWRRDTGFDSVGADDLLSAVWGDRDCAVVTGRQSAWTKVGGEWRQGVIRVATTLGDFHFADITGNAFGRGMPFWASGQYSTVVRGAVCDAAGVATPTVTGAQPTATLATATPTTAPAASSVMLPLCGR